MSIFIKKNGALQQVSVFTKSNNALKIVRQTNLSEVEGVEPEPMGDAYVTFSSSSDFTFTIPIVLSERWDGNLECSNDGINWDRVPKSSLNGDNYIKTSLNKKIYLRGIGNTYINVTQGTNLNGSGGWWSFSNDNMSFTGNLETLLDYQTVLNGGHPTMASGAFQGLFSDAEQQSSSPANYNANLRFTEIPEIPFTQLVTRSFRYLFCNIFTGSTTSFSVDDVYLYNVTHIKGNSAVDGISQRVHFGTNLIYIGLDENDSATNSVAFVATGGRTYYPYLYFHFTENDTPQFSLENQFSKGANKSVKTYYVYTDNSTLKTQALSNADSYTTINVKHLNGSDW